MTDAIVPQESHSLSKKPLEWLEIAEQSFTESMQRMSAAIIQDCDETETAMIHNWVKRSSESLKAFQTNARERLLAYVLEKGEQVTDKGTLQIRLDNGHIQRAVPTNTKPDDRLTQQLLRAKGFSLDAHMDKEVTWYANDAKLRALVDTEQMTEAEYKQCFGKLAYRVGASRPANEDEDD